MYRRNIHKVKIQYIKIHSLLNLLVFCLSDLFLNLIVIFPQSTGETKYIQIKLG